MASAATPAWCGNAIAATKQPARCNRLRRVRVAPLFPADTSTSLSCVISISLRRLVVIGVETDTGRQPVPEHCISHISSANYEAIQAFRLLGSSMLERFLTTDGQRNSSP